MRTGYGQPCVHSCAGPWATASAREGAGEGVESSFEARLRGGPHEAVGVGGRGQTLR